jgi:hypothetical protein
MSRPRLLAFTILLALTVPLAAQDFWQAKPFSAWTKAETDKMLNDSPWAQHITLSRVVMAGFSTGVTPGSPGIGNPTAVSEAQHSELPRLTYTAQLRSAMPVRQAVVRQRQIAEGYDNKKPDQRASLDAKTNAYLEKPQDDIVVYVAVESNVVNYANQAQRYWKQQTFDLVKNKVFLTIGRERLAPVGFAATDVAFQFNFERPAEILHEGSVTLEFTHPPIGSLPTEQVRIEFKLNKMLVNGEPAI